MILKINAKCAIISAIFALEQNGINALRVVRGIICKIIQNALLFVLIADNSQMLLPKNVKIAAKNAPFVMEVLTINANHAI